MDIIIVSPSLDPQENVSGVSAVVNFIIQHDPNHHYIHFKQGRKDREVFIIRIFSLIVDYFKWLGLLCKHRNAIVHYNFPLTSKAIFRDFFFIRTASILGFKMVIHIHGGNYLMEDPFHPLVKRMLKLVFSLPCSFIVLSNKEKECIQRRFRSNNIFVLPNAVDIPETTRTSNFHKPLNILFIGRIAASKGVEYIIEAAVKMKGRVPFRLIFAGEEEKKDKYIPYAKKRLGEDYFQYVGIISGQAKTDLFNKCDVFLLPSFYEGLPISMLECMSFGIVPVVTNVGSISSCVTDEENGLIISQKDSDVIIDAIKELSRDRQLLDQLSQKARETIREKFSPEKYIKTLSQIYDQINSESDEK